MTRDQAPTQRPLDIVTKTMLDAANEFLQTPLGVWVAIGIAISVAATLYAYFNWLR